VHLNDLGHLYTDIFSFCILGVKFRGRTVARGYEFLRKSLDGFTRICFNFDGFVKSVRLEHTNKISIKNLNELTPRIQERKISTGRKSIIYLYFFFFFFFNFSLSLFVSPYLTRIKYLSLPVLK
jgi:hypothetical protein